MYEYSFGGDGNLSLTSLTKLTLCYIIRVLRMMVVVMRLLLAAVLTNCHFSVLPKRHYQQLRATEY